VQDGHPDPPVVCVAELSASVQWRALLAGRVVSDVRIERPTVHLNLMQVRHEARDEASVQERDWRALGSLLPQQQRDPLHSAPSLAGKSARE
jgi:uncharacterized protein involved in outer membrane biogenesis